MTKIASFSLLQVPEANLFQQGDQGLKVQRRLGGEGRQLSLQLLAELWVSGSGSQNLLEVSECVHALVRLRSVDKCLGL